MLHQLRAALAWAVDVHEFELKLPQADDLALDDPAVWQRVLEEAVALYQGDLLPSCYDEWPTPVPERLRQAFLETLERLLWLAEERLEVRLLTKVGLHLVPPLPHRALQHRRGELTPRDLCLAQFAFEGGAAGEEFVHFGDDAFLFGEGWDSYYYF